MTRAFAAHLHFPPCAISVQGTRLLSWFPADDARQELGKARLWIAWHNRAAAPILNDFETLLRRFEVVEDGGA